MIILIVAFRAKSSLSSRKTQRLAKIGLQICSINDLMYSIESTKIHLKKKKKLIFRIKFFYFSVRNRFNAFLSFN